MSEQNDAFNETENEDSETNTDTALAERPVSESQKTEAAPGTDTKSESTEQPAERPAPHLSGNKWETDFRAPDPILPKTQNDNSSAKEPTEWQRSLRESLNQPLPGKLNDLIAEHGRCFLILRGDKGRIPRDLRGLFAQRHALVKAAINAFQPAKAPSMGANEQAHNRQAHKNRPEMRLAKLEKLKSAKTAHEADPTFFGSIPLNTVHPVPAHIKWLLGRELVWMAVTMVRWELCRYELKRLESFNLTNPADRVEEIKAQFAEVTDPATIKLLQEELATLSLPTSEHTALAASRSLHDDWSKVEFYIRMLLEWSLDELEASRELLIEGEKMIFAEHPMGISHEATVISKSLEPVIKQFRDQLAAKDKPIRTAPGLAAVPKDGEHTVLKSIFGLNILDETSPQVEK